jgi:hypothetical protein
METIRPNLIIPARKVQPSRRLGLPPEATIGMTAIRETRTAIRGFIEIIVSINL